MDNQAGKRAVGAALALLLLASPAAGASASPSASRAEVSKQLVGTTLVRGQIDIEADGSVSNLELEAEEKLEPGVVRFVRQTAEKWRFEPVTVDGKEVAVRSSVSVRLIASQGGQEQVRIHVSGVDFGNIDDEGNAWVQKVSMKAPAYPNTASTMGGAGTVYVVIRIGRDGKVEDAMAEQVNLRAVGTEKQMQEVRDSLSSSALAAARRWTFRPPTEGPHVDAPFWTVRVPVSFLLNRQKEEDSPGLWVAYVPGPRYSAPWLADDDAPGFSPDTLAEGGIYMADRQGPRLLTPLGGE